MELWKYNQSLFHFLRSNNIMSMERVKNDKITTDENRQPKKEVRVNLFRVLCMSVCVCCMCQSWGAEQTVQLVKSGWTVCPLSNEHQSITNISIFTCIYRWVFFIDSYSIRTMCDACGATPTRTYCLDELSV